MKKNGAEMMKRTNKSLFVIPIHSVVDTITNSSSELFVGINASKEELEAAIEVIYPEYLTEYHPLVTIDELEAEDLDLYFDYATSPGHWPTMKYEYPILPGFTFEELYEPELNEDGIEKKAWNEEVQYQIKNNVINPEHKWDRAFVTQENFEEIKNKLDPNRQMFFLFSIEENPDWEMQEKLEQFMIRYHLG